MKKSLKTPENESKSIGFSENTIPSTLMFGQHYRVSLMVIIITFASVCSLGYLGHLLDLAFTQNSAFMVVGIIVSFPLTQVLIYKWVTKSYMARVKSQSQKE